MLIILALHFLASQGTQALPIQADRAIDQSTSASCSDIGHCRTIWNIIWSCSVTIFGCTWVAVHPNIPQAEEKWFTTALRRLQLMVMALIAPELVISWAMRQWLAARSLAKDNQKYQWTQTHGFFFIMGGFVNGFTPMGEIDFHYITENEIRDRSKGDVLSKGLVVIQTGWFILQCIARPIKGLPLTELELVTLAFAALNFVTYGLWWNKPLNVRYPVRVPMKRRKGEGEAGKGASKSGEDNGGRDTIVHAIRDAIKRSVEYVRKHRWTTLWNGAKAVFGYGIWTPLYQFISMGFDDNDEGMFYAGSLKSENRWSCAIAGAIIATIFGAIHCIAWSFQFPSYKEKLLWRIASLSITCSPMVAVLTARGVKHIEYNWEGWTARLLARLLAAIVIVLSILYILSRVALLVIMLMSLRSLPPGAYETVHWTTFIPHV